MAEREFVVTAERAGERLDAFLAEAAGSRTNAAKLISEGAVSVEGRPRPKRHVVRAGERVVIADPEPVHGGAPGDRSGAPSGWATSAHPDGPGGPTTATDDGAADADDAARGFTVAYEDDYLLVVDKAAGLVVHPGRGHREGTLSQTLGLGIERGGVVHRLDRDTSGLLVVAKTERVQRELQAMIKARTVHREYLALVAGTPESRTGTIDAPIGRDRHVRTIHSLDTDTPREARTHFELIETFGAASLLRVRLETGRTHQIRVHMLAIGHPVLGDPTYAGAGAGRIPGLERQFLHAARLAFSHPATSEPMDVSSPLPADLEAALTGLSQKLD